VGDTLELEHGELAVAKQPLRRRARIASEREAQTFYESALSTAPTILTPEEQRELRKIQADADRDPHAYVEACRRRTR
jgi:hypothetical protein